jgi:uncharacterized membrane protein
MKPVWKWLLGILAALVLLSALAMPFMKAQFNSFGGYRMMSGPRSGWGMPMMGGFGWLGFSMLFSGLIQLGVLILIVLAIIWLVRAISRQDQKSN